MRVVREGQARLLLVGLLALSVGCDAPRSLDPVASQNDTAHGNQRKGSNEQSAGDLNRESVHSIAMTGAGSFRPGEPIVVHATVGALRASLRTTIDITVLDLPLTDAAAGRREVAHWQGGMLQSARRDDAVSVVFEQAGYYRIIARAQGELESAETSRDPMLSRFTSVVIWVLVDEAGGRLTDGYDPAALRGRSMLFGAYGPFVPSNAVPSEVRSRRGGPSADASRVFSTILDGYIKYNDAFTGYKGVPGRISGTCMGRSENAIIYDLFTDVLVYVEDNGYFMAECPDGYEYFSGVFSLTGSYSDAYGKNGAAAGTTVSGYLGGSALQYVVNDAAASAFKKVEHYAPIANSRFSRSRSKVTMWISDVYNDTGWEWRWCAGCGASELIIGNRQGAFGEEGIFSVIHEYGHLFHRGALGATYGTSACTQRLAVSAETTLQCAYREGFADFFAAWIAGDSLMGSSGFPTDYNLEQNIYLSTGQNGAITEGAVASFLYDLVDGSSDPNSATNLSGTADDGIGYPGSYLADVIQNCSITVSGGGTITILDGIDQVIYCLQRSVDDQSVVNQSTGYAYFVVRNQTYSGVSAPSNTPSGWSTSVNRQAWKYDLFLHGSLP